MSQHDYVIANDSGASVRADINSALQAILSQNSGTSEPSSTSAGTLWLDTTGGAPYTLKIRDAGNNHWLNIASVTDPGADGDITLSGELATSKLTGSFAYTNFPSDSILQVQTTINTTLNTINASTAERDTGISVSLTPKISGSKILIMADLSCGVAIATGLGLIIKRTGPSNTSLQIAGSGSYQFGKAFYYSSITQDGSVWSATGQFTDTAQDASTAHVYNMWVQTNNSAIVAVNRRDEDTFWGSTSSIIAMEIKA